MNDPLFPALLFMRKLLLGLPATEEKLCFGTPAFYVGKKLFVRIREDWETLAIYTEERDKWLAADPAVYFVTDHYLNYNYMLVNLEKADPAALELLLLAAWKKRAPKRIAHVLDQENE